VRLDDDGSERHMRKVLDLRVNYGVQLMLSYPDIAERAGTPIVVTIFREVRAYPGGPQTGVYAFTLAPGNCLPTSARPFITVWPGAMLDFEGDEANDNARMGVVS
jgi:hypothetical protein